MSVFPRIGSSGPQRWCRVDTARQVPMPPGPSAGISVFPRIAVQGGHIRFAAGHQGDDGLAHPNRLAHRGGGRFDHQGAAPQRDKQQDRDECSDDKAGHEENELVGRVVGSRAGGRRLPFRGCHWAALPYSQLRPAEDYDRQRPARDCALARTTRGLGRDR